MESDEVIKSSVENLVPILSESEGIPDSVCDVPLCNNPTPLEAFKEPFLRTINDSNDESTIETAWNFEASSCSAVFVLAITKTSNLSFN
ncbi:hypothetical protein Tco_0599564 [Tanacetum coccineum]